jgi:hypothetical protein
VLDTTGSRFVEKPFSCSVFEGWKLLWTTLLSHVGKAWWRHYLSGRLMQVLSSFSICPMDTNYWLQTRKDLASFLNIRELTCF